MTKRILFGLVLLLSLAVAQAVVVNNVDYTSKFNDSSTEINITFTGGDNQTFYVDLPKYAQVDLAQLNVTSTNSLNNTWLEVGTPDGTREFNTVNFLVDPFLNQSEDYFVIIHATELNQTLFETDGNQLELLYPGVWVFYNNGTDYEVSRSTVMNGLFYQNSSSPLITGATGITKIETYDLRDVGKRGVYAFTTISGGPGSELTTTLTGTFTNTADNYNVSSWSYVDMGSNGNWARWEIASGTTRNTAPAGGASNEINADTSADQINNPANMQLDAQMDSNSGNNVRVTLLSDGNLTWSYSTSGSLGSPSHSHGYFDYFDDAGIPEFSLLDDNSLLFNDSGRVNDFSTAINTYLSSCTADSNGNCQVPHLFHSDSAGVLKVNDLDYQLTQYQANYSFIDSITSNSVNPTCTIDGVEFNYTTFTSFNVTNSRAIVCYKNGYVSYTHTTTLSNTSLDESISLTPHYFNLLFRDEQNGSLLNGVNVSVEFISIGFYQNGTTNTGNFSAGISSAANYTIRYSAPGYGRVRQYHYELSNQSFSNITLYLLSNTSSEQITVTVYKRPELTSLEGAFVYLQRYDGNTSSYKTVAMYKTDLAGKAYLEVEKDNVLYKFQVDYPLGTLRTTTEESELSASDYNLYVNLDAEVAEGFFKESGITYSLSYNNATQQFTGTFSDVANSATQFCLYIKKYGQYSQTVLNSSCVSTSSGSITLGGLLTNQTNYAVLTATISGEERVLATGWIDLYSDDLNSGTFGYFMAAIVIMVIVFLSSLGTMTSLLAGAGLVFSKLFGLLPIDWTYVFIMVIASVVLGIFLEVWRR